jgi:hypothetical protein
MFIIHCLPTTGTPCTAREEDFIHTLEIMYCSLVAFTIRPCLQARVVAVGSQDLGFRTSIFGSQDLSFKTSINGHWVSLSEPEFQDFSILRSSYLFLVTFLCVHRHFSLRPMVIDGRTNRQTHATSEFIYKIFILTA